MFFPLIHVFAQIRPRDNHLGTIGINFHHLDVRRSGGWRWHFWRCVYRCGSFLFRQVFLPGCHGPNTGHTSPPYPGIRSAGNLAPSQLYLGPIRIFFHHEGVGLVLCGRNSRKGNRNKKEQQGHTNPSKTKSPLQDMDHRISEIYNRLF